MTNKCKYLTGTVSPDFFVHKDGSVNMDVHQTPRSFFDLVPATESFIKGQGDNDFDLWVKTVKVDNLRITYYCLESPKTKKVK